MERRAAVRFLLHAPAIIRWTDGSGAKREDVGRTRDISTSGAFLTCRAPIPVGTTVGLEIHLPALERNALQRMRLESTGKIVRIKKEVAQRVGFAVSGPFTLHDHLLGAIGPGRTQGRNAGKRNRQSHGARNQQVD